MRKLHKNQSGFAHIAMVVILSIVVLGSISVAGYRIYKDNNNSIAYQGTLYKEKCTTTVSVCTGYTLTTSNDKKYNLAGTSALSVASGTPVTVTGSTPTTSSSGKSTITVTKITPTSTAVTSTATSPTTTTTTSTLMPTDPLPSYIKGYIYITYSCGNLPRGASCTNQPEPYQATVSVETTAGVVVTSFSSASDGSFSVALPAETYLLVPNLYASGSVKASQQTVTVTEGQTTNATINYKGLTP